jgi:hypothetical protein
MLYRQVPNATSPLTGVEPESGLVWSSHHSREGRYMGEQHCGERHYKEVVAGPRTEQDCAVKRDRPVRERSRTAQGCMRWATARQEPTRCGRSRASDSPMPGEGRSPNSPADEELTLPWPHLCCARRSSGPSACMPRSVPKKPAATACRHLLAAPCHA